MKHLDLIITWVKAAGAKSEEHTDIDGFLSYHAETHALGMGIAAGFAAIAFNELALFGLIYAAAVHGRVGQSGKKRRRIIQDVKQEPHYALAGIVVGGLAAVPVRLVQDLSALPSLPF